MGTDRKTPLSEAGGTAPGRTQKTQQRSKVARTRLIVGGVVVLAVVGGLAYLATSGGEDDGPLAKIFGGGDDDREVPEVTLNLKKATYDATSAEADPEAQASTTEKAAGAVQGALQTMLRTAYVDPDTWDDAGAVAESFTGDAADRVEADIAVLTMGEDAGDTYEFMDPGKGAVTIQILTGSRGEALRAYADLTFPGLAEHDDGTYTKVTVQGSYFLFHEDGAWKIVSYRVDRQEKDAKGPETASPTSATPSGDASG